MRKRGLLRLAPFLHTGDTLRVARAHLEALCPAEVRTAVLHEKTCSQIRTDYAAGTIEEWRWLTYPWAVAEDLGGVIGEVDPPPASAADAGLRLLEGHNLGVPPLLLERVMWLVASRDAA